MTRAEFQRLAEAVRMRNTPSLDAARMVLTGDMRPGEAARTTGCSPQAVTNALRKIKNARVASAQDRLIKFTDRRFVR